MYPKKASAIYPSLVDSTNSNISLNSFDHKSFCKEKHDIACVGIAWASALRTFLCALDNTFHATRNRGYVSKFDPLSSETP